jgi:hypothetical protein
MQLSIKPNPFPTSACQTVSEAISGFQVRSNKKITKFKFQKQVFDSLEANLPMFVYNLKWDNPQLFRKLYFPGNDTPTTNEGFSPSVVGVYHFQR